MTLFRWDAPVEQQPVQLEPLYSPPFMAVNKEDGRIALGSWQLVEWQAARSVGGNQLSFSF